MGQRRIHRLQSNYSSRTAMQRAYEAGEKKAREEERERFYKKWKIKFGVDVILWQKGEKEAMSVYDFITPTTSELDQDKK